MPRMILIVDDSAINRQMLINTLQNDYSIMEAENGKEALSLMHRHYKMLSAVLLDILMPEIDGYEVLRRVSENTLLSQIPIIMVTGSEDEASRVKALSLGANDFITKPFNPEIVKHCLKNNIALRETASILNAIQKDKLTGLYNREAFFEKIGEMIKNKEPGYYVLSCFDIDNFKLINDQYGAVEGDRILKEIGKVVRSSMDRAGGISGRISADNFAVLYPAADEDNDELAKSLYQRFVTLDQWSIVLSIGRYVVTEKALSASAIYDRAYLAKQSVKGRYDKHVAYFDETMLQKLVRDQQIVSDMETALSERQFEVLFQPQYNHISGSLYGAEALVRWRHPQKGVVPPGEFIPLFEQNGFVYELDKYVWRETCRYLRKWTDAGLSPLPVSVNVSRYDIFRADFIDAVTGIVREFGVPIELLRLEITESAFAQSTAMIVDIVKQLIAFGFTIEIDDFGSGYSSLNTLKDVPAQVIKLDMRFLEDGDDEQRGGNILESIARMAKWLGMSVIAEGVETVEQGNFLKSIGCSYVQGYLYARPMPADEFEALFVNSAKEEKLPPLKTAENIDNNMFWNPRSLDSLIFNSFVGSACIYENHNGSIELLRATDSFARMLGGDDMTVDRLLNIDLSACLNNEHSSAELARVDALLRSKGEATGEFLYTDLPGDRPATYLHSTLRVIATTDDRYLVYCISENITAQRIAEQNERAGSRRLQAILDNINIGITAVAIDGSQMEYLLANDKFYELLGYTREQYRREIGKDVYAAIYPVDREYITAMTAQVTNTEVSASMEFRARRRDGSIIWLRSYLSITSFEGVDKPVQLCTFADISAEKHSAQDLLDNLPCGAGICVLNDNDAHITYLNKRYYSYFTQRIDKSRTQSVFSVIHPDDRGTLHDAMLPAFDKGGEGSCVVRVSDGPDRYIPFRLSGRALEADGGEKSIYVTFVPLSHEELSFSEMLPIVLEKMMEASSDLCFVKDRDLRYISCSSAFAQAAGFNSGGDIVGKTDAELCDQELAARFAGEDRKVIETGEPIIELVESCPLPDGKTRYSSTSKYPLCNPRGEVIGLFGIGRDITLAREAEAQQEFLINNIPGGIAVYEGQWVSLKSIHLSYFSDGFSRLFGYTREEYERLGHKNPTGLVKKEYIPGLIAQIEQLITKGTAIDYTYRAQSKDNSELWIHVKAVSGEKHGENMTVNAVFLDVTEQQEALERLRISEEENRLALQHSPNTVCRFDIAARSLKVSSGSSTIFEQSSVIEGIPSAQVKSGDISPESAEAYVSFFEGIIAGESSGSAVFQHISEQGWRWIEAHSSTIFSSDGAPVSAVISFADVTESFEKDAAYKKWLQSLQNKTPGNYSLFRCNVNKQTQFDKVEGSLIDLSFNTGNFKFDELTAEYALRSVVDEDRGHFRGFLTVDSLIKSYYAGERNISMEYREKLPNGDYRWLSLSVDLVEYAHSADVEAYILFENIDEAKRQELLTLERAETDPLTGILNRTAFAEKADGLIHASPPGTKHALLMLDVDGFKLVNDVFGHGAGDHTLIDIAALLRTILRRDDLVGRLGGDEFVVFLNDIPEEGIAANKARQICELVRKNFSAEVRISGSVGIALYPQDGTDFGLLYKKADQALYHVKGSGRDNFAFYHDDIKDEPRTPRKAFTIEKTPEQSEKKRRMLIVDDNRIDFEFLANMFRSEYIIERANDGNTAIVRLRHYSTAISVVLLDLMMPGMDGFAVLEMIQRSPEISMIPVVVVSAADDRETSLRAIREGATDYVMKPVDADVLRIRVQSAVSKAENERLRAKNSYLELQSAETLRYKTVLDRIGVTVAELDWGKGEFTYSPQLGKKLAGHYDGRTLWHILLSDMVADVETVSALQGLVHKLADDRDKTKESMTARFKTPSGKRRMFDVTLYKLTNEYGLTDKIIFSFMAIETQN